ncbi:LysE family translocator [Malaciobacter pacificus]|uniref:Transporter, LysE family n=1 Tax=Malaciobacter pacificus TaxID=1080223 RepID=A0A5C2HD53_9BACT|nr:LysE family translocator [Malaciobacter pacificus]QEP35066.1 transporter, LysE family [Malaciobacter pacificus]GGD48394.1 LysE family translocator [Malaciobacter pacificus]
MIEDSNLLMFILSAILLSLSPGPDNIYVLTLGISKTKKAAVVTTLGLCSGLVIHTLAAALGISVIFQVSQIAFDIVKYIGAIYLLYIAYQIFKHRNDPISLEQTQNEVEYKKLYLRGFIMNILNPKVSIFFLAFLPQFVDTSSSNIPLQMIFLGLIFIIVAFIIFSIIGILGNILRQKVLAKKEVFSYLNIFTSLVLVGLSIKLALSSR